MRYLYHPLILILLVFFSVPTHAQRGRQWTPDGKAYYSFSKDGIDIVDLKNPEQKTSFLTSEELIPENSDTPLAVQSFEVSKEGNKLLLFANTRKVWRLRTRGDYWVFDEDTKKLTQVGKGLPEASLMFAKFSPDGTKVAYVSKHNLYIEDLKTHKREQITHDGTARMINGTFDWVYEEEFGARDGFRWSPDSKRIAYWKLDATKIRNYLMLNTTDSLYSFTVPVEYPKVGTDPSKTNLWIYDLKDKSTEKVKVEGSEVQHYIPRMEWLKDGSGIIFQRLNRRQNESKIWIADAKTGKTKLVHAETADTWIDIKTRWAGTPVGWDWIDNGKAFIWLSEKDGWRHIYKINLKGKETLLTKAPFDVMQVELIDKKHHRIYFSASPDNATEKYLYEVGINGGKEKRITPAKYHGTASYSISPNGEMANFNFSSIDEMAMGAVVSLPQHKELKSPNFERKADPNAPQTEFFRVTTEDGITMDGWVRKPKNFDSNKKYPLLLYVYGEPASQTVTNTFGQGRDFLYNGDLAEDGYLYVSLDNEGSPAPKGTKWRKSIYKKIGRLNIRDQAMGVKKLMEEWGYVDPDRVGVWGWSGGGSSTLNLLGQYPEIFKVGIAIAPVADQLLYDNVYQERYMGLLPEDKEGFVKGSPVTYAKNVKGDLLLIHGTGDDNVHFQNTERYINEMVKYDIPFQLMIYPNRTHAISEGPGTSKHLRTTYTKFLKTHLPGGPKDRLD